MKRRKLWKMGEDGLCHSSSAIQTRLGPSSLLEEQCNLYCFCCFICVVGYPQTWGNGQSTVEFRLSGYHGTLLLPDNQICRIIGYLFPLDINLIRNFEI